MKYFIFATVFIFSAFALHAQDFFIPGNALSSSADKLKPLIPNAEESLSGFSQRRYKVIDGRVIALPNEPELGENNTQNNQETQRQVEPSSAVVAESPQQAFQPNDTPSPAFSEMLAHTLPQPAQPSYQPEQPDQAEYQPTVQKSETDVQFNIPQPEPPLAQNVDNSLPSYKNRYSLYLEDLKVFQKTGKLPQNIELKNILERLTTPREIILFDGDLK